MLEPLVSLVSKTCSPVRRSHNDRGDVDIRHRTRSTHDSLGHTPAARWTRLVTGTNLTKGYTQTTVANGQAETKTRTRHTRTRTPVVTATTAAATSSRTADNDNDGRLLLLLCHQSFRTAVTAATFLVLDTVAAAVVVVVVVVDEIGGSCTVTAISFKNETRRD